MGHGSKDASGGSRYTEVVVSLLNVSDLGEFADLVDLVDLVREKQMDGTQMLSVTENLQKVWPPHTSSNEFITFVGVLRSKPDKFTMSLRNGNKVETKISDSRIVSIENQYQTVTVKKIKEETFSTPSNQGVEDILNRIKPAKSFLYRNQTKRSEKSITSYVSMNAGSKKPKWFLRLSSYEHPFYFNSKNSKAEYNDRGYYTVKTNDKGIENANMYAKPDRTKYKSLSAVEELSEQIIEEHFYEDLCYNQTKAEGIKSKENIEINAKTRLVKFQDLLQSIKLPFVRRSLKSKLKNEADTKPKVNEVEESAEDTYDSVELTSTEVSIANNHEPLQDVEEYLEPIQPSREYSDVSFDQKQKEESLLSYIMTIFETRFGLRKVTPEENQSSSSNEADVKDLEDKKPMASRPLPIPVESEPYYMAVDRTEAENLLRGHPDGTFLLRPSTQPNHAYTLSVSCAGAVHNVGIRRRPDGRLALGFARRGERSFNGVHALLKHHRTTRVLLVGAGGVLGATILIEPPQYYQTPKNIPVIL